MYRIRPYIHILMRRSRRSDESESILIRLAVLILVFVLILILIGIRIALIRRRVRGTTAVVLRRSAGHTGKLSVKRILIERLVRVGRGRHAARKRTPCILSVGNIDLYREITRGYIQQRHLTGASAAGICNAVAGVVGDENMHIASIDRHRCKREITGSDSRAARVCLAVIAVDLTGIHAVVAFDNSGGIGKRFQCNAVILIVALDKILNLAHYLVPYLCRRRNGSRKRAQALRHCVAEPYTRNIVGSVADKPAVAVVGGSTRLARNINAVFERYRACGTAANDVLHQLCHDSCGLIAYDHLADGVSVINDDIALLILYLKDGMRLGIDTAVREYLILEERAVARFSSA